MVNLFEYVNHGKINENIKKRYNFTVINAIKYKQP